MASSGPDRQAGFVFLVLRKLFAAGGGGNPRYAALAAVVFFGSLLTIFFVIDGVSWSSYRLSEGFILLVYVAAGVFATIFRFYDLIFARTPVGRRLRTAIQR